MITYKTEIISMATVTEPIQNYITSVNFKITAILDSINISVDSFVNFDIDSTLTDLAPYSQLTEEEVLSWIDSTLIGSLQLSLQSQINAILNPPITPEVTPLPWASE